MNTILKTGTAMTALLLALLAPAGGAASARPAPDPIRAAGLVEECRQSPTLVEQWARHGEPLPPCVIQHNLQARHFADDRRSAR
jgi:hypothetical protein